MYVFLGLIIKIGIYYAQKDETSFGAEMSARQCLRTDLYSHKDAEILLSVLFKIKDTINKVNNL